MENDGNFLKVVINEAPKKNWEKPTDRDEVSFNLKATLLEKDPHLTNDDDYKEEGILLE